MDNMLEEGRGFRQRKKQADPLCCPVCGITLRPSEFEQHLAIEVDRLNKLSGPGCSKVRKTTGGNSPKEQPQVPSNSTGNTENNVISPDASWGTYQKIKNNRQTRLRIKTRKRKAEENICPVCNERTSEDINMHVESCLRKSENNSRNSNGNASDDESIDIEGGTFSEYEWAGQTRIRASSLLPGGGYAATGMGTSINSSIDDDEELIVDDDDTQIYGPPQYSERDVIPIDDNSLDNCNDNLYIRNLITNTDPHATAIHRDTSEVNNDDENSSDQTSQQTDDNNDEQMIINFKTNISDEEDIATDVNNLIKPDHIKLQALKLRIKEYEKQIKNKIKCLICLDDYKIPVVSICCWHVHCEKCWLHALGARKLCPQCNMITSPTDLRRIYM